MIKKPKSSPTVNQVSQDQPLKSSEDVSTEPKTTRKIQKPKPVIKTFELNNDNLKGISPIITNENEKYVISAEQDAELTAIAQAFKKRGEILFGEQLKEYRKTTIHSIDANIRGFDIKYVYQIRGEKILKNNLVITTPTKGVLLFKNQVLTNLRKTTYEDFMKALNDAGIEIVKDEEALVEGNMIVQMNFQPESPPSTLPKYLIGKNRVGEITLNLPVNQIEARLPDGFRYIKRTVRVEDKDVVVHKIFDTENKTLFYIRDKESKVWKIQITDERFRNPLGIGIGTTLAQMKIYYPLFKLTKIDKGDPFFQDPETGAKFMIQSEGMDFENLNFPETNQISSILIESSEAEK